MHILIRTIVFSYIGIFTCNLASAEIKQLTLKSYPVTTADCSTQLKVFESRLNAYASVQILSSECRKGDFTRGGMNLNFKFVGDIATNPDFEARLYGGYESKVACDRDLVFQKRLFIRKTGKGVFAGYCSPNGYPFIYSLTNRSANNIQVFDSSLRGKYSPLSDILLPNKDDLKIKVRRAFEKHGASVARVKLTDSGHLYVYYYSSKRLNFQFVQFTGYSQMEICTGQQAVIANMIQFYGGQAEVGICAATDRFPMPGAELFTLSSFNKPFMFSQIFSLYQEDLGKSYVDFMSCQGDRGRVTNLYNSIQGVKVHGVYCSFDAKLKSYRMLVFRRRAR